MKNQSRTFLFAMFEGGGNVPAQLSIARRLTARGHRVHVLGDEAKRRTFSTYERAPQRCAGSFKGSRAHSSNSPLEQLRRVGEQLMFRPAGVRVPCSNYVRPDALAIDCIPLGLIVGAEKSGLPAALLYHMPYNAPVEGSTPFGLGLRPARGLLGRLRDRVLVGLMKWLFRRGLAPVNAARRALDLPPLREVFDQFHALSRTLVLTSAHFDFVHLNCRAFATSVRGSTIGLGHAVESPWSGERDPLVP
jgi:hypothetical protein